MGTLLANVILHSSMVGHKGLHIFNIATSIPVAKAESKAKALQTCRPDNADIFRVMVETIPPVVVGDAEIAVSSANVQHIKKQEKVQLRYFKNIEGGKITPLGINKLENAGFRVSKGGRK